MKTAVLKTLIGAALLCGSGMASAAEQGLYIGGGVGSADTGRSGYDDSSGSSKFFVGARNEGMSFELGYIDLGKFKQTSTPANAYDVDGFQINVIGETFLSKGVDGYASFGFYNWDLNANGAVADDSGTSVTFGLGLKASLGDHIFARGGWERFNKIADESSNLLSLSLGYRF